MWKTHIDYLAKKLSKVCGMIYKLHHYVPLSTLRIVYYSMFHSHIQYCLINGGRAVKSHYHKLSILQNKILRACACLFRPRRHETNLLYSRFRVLKLEDMIKMEFAKFMFKYSNYMLPNSFNNHFIKLENIHNYNTRQKSRNEYFQTFFSNETGKKMLHHLGLNKWKSILQEYRQCSFIKFKKFCKNKLLHSYN